MSFLQQLLRSGVGYTREGGEIIYNWKDNPVLLCIKEN